MDRVRVSLLEALGEYKHVAPGACARACSSLLSFFTLSTESAGRVVSLSRLSHKAIDALRVLRVHMLRNYGHVQAIMEEFDEVASSLQTQMDDVMSNTELDILAKKLN